MPDAQGLLSAVSAAAALRRGPGAAHQPPALPDKGLSGKVAQLLGGMFSTTRISRNPQRWKMFHFLARQLQVLSTPEMRPFTILAFLWDRKKIILIPKHWGLWNLRSHMPFTPHFETLGFYSLIQRVNESLRIETQRMAACWQYFGRGQVLWPFLFWEAEAEGAMRPSSESRAFELVLCPKLFGHFSYVLGQTDLILFSFQDHCTYSASIFSC